MEKTLTKYAEIEQEFSKLLSDDKNRWIEMYKLLVIVEKNALWREAGQRSFTSWVKEMAIKYNVHESVIWQRKKAGAVFTDYATRIEMRGESAPDPSITNIPAESLELINKIGKNNPVIVDDLITKSINGTMARDELRQVWRSSKSIQSARVNTGDSNNKNDNNPLGNSNPARVEIEQQTATDIVTGVSPAKRAKRTLRTNSQ